MRIAVAALCVLALTGSADAERMPCAEYDAIPEQARQTPTVEWTLYQLPLDQVRQTCRNATATACSYPNADGTWTVIVPKDYYSDLETACVEQYELAHLPPNYFGDPKVEAPATIKWLEEQKRANR